MVFLGLIPSVSSGAVSGTKGALSVVGGLSVGTLLGGVGAAVAGLLAFPQKTAKTDLKSVNEFLGYSAKEALQAEPEIPNPLVGGQEAGAYYRVAFQYGHWNSGDSYFFTAYSISSRITAPISALYMYEILGSADPFTEGQRFDVSGEWTQSNRRRRFGGVRNYQLYVDDALGNQRLIDTISSEEMARFGQPYKEDGSPDTGGNLSPIKEAEYVNSSPALDVPPPDISNEKVLEEVLNKLGDVGQQLKEISANTSIKSIPSQQQPTDFIEPPSIPDAETLPRVLPNLPNYNSPNSPIPRFLPDRVLATTTPSIQSVPTQGLTVSSAPSNPSSISLNKTPKKDSLRVPFALNKTDFDCDKLTECISGGLDFGDIADIINDQTQNIILKTPNCQEDSEGNKEIVVVENPYTVPANLGDALVLLNSQLLEIYSSQCRNSPYIIGVPDAWEVKRAIYPKQEIMLFRSEMVNGRYFYKKVAVPHIINESPNYNLTIPAYTSGDIYLRLYFQDGSLFHLYVDSEVTANNILNAVVPLLEQTQLFTPNKYTIALKRGSSIAVRNWKPIAKSFYNSGGSMKYQNVVWEKRFADSPN